MGCSLVLKDPESNSCGGLVNEGYKRLDSSTRLSTLNETMFKPQGTQNATLKAKAAETRSLLYVMIEVCKEADDSSDHHQHRLRMLEHIGAIYDIFKASGNFLPRAKADEALEHLHDFYEHYAWMAHAAIREGKFRYPITTKMHELYHIVDLARWFNPCKIWCYEFESFMHVIITITKNCTAGSRMAIIGNKFIENYLLVLNLTLSYIND